MQLYFKCAPNPTAYTKFHPTRPKHKKPNSGQKTTCMNKKGITINKKNIYQKRYYIGTYIAIILPFYCPFL